MGGAGLPEQSTVSGFASLHNHANNDAWNTWAVGAAVGFSQTWNSYILTESHVILCSLFLCLQSVWCSVRSSEKQRSLNQNQSLCCSWRGDGHGVVDAVPDERPVRGAALHAAPAPAAREGRRDVELVKVEPEHEAVSRVTCHVSDNMSRVTWAGWRRGSCGRACSCTRPARSPWPGRSRSPRSCRRTTARRCSTRRNLLILLDNKNIYTSTVLLDKWGAGIFLTRTWRGWSPISVWTLLDTRILSSYQFLSTDPPSPCSRCPWGRPPPHTRCSRSGSQGRSW